MAGFFKQLVGWWDGQSIGTELWTRRNGTRVGEDAEGNVYYHNSDGSRRWVFYAGDNDASHVPPEWFGWLHHTLDAPPTEAPLTHKPWEKPHHANLTGSVDAFARSGSLRRTDPKPQTDYEAWTPE
ncbi:MAG: NADH:ubiquinone oxidoreductase subunit NDUFA12 [Pseudomonadota bacterium]